MAEIIDAEVRMNGKQAVTELEKCRKKVEELERAWAKAKDEEKDALEKTLRSQLRAARQELRQVQSGTEAVKRVMNQLSKATPDDLNRSLKFLTRELKYIERGSSAWTEQVNKIKLVKAELDKVNAEMKVSKSLFERMRDGINNWGASIAAGAGSIAGIVAAGKKAINTYAEMDQEMANVRKYTGMTADQVAHLNEEFKKMDTRTSREGLNQLAQEAGRLGKTSEEDVLGFVRAADKINVALDELGDGATLTLSKLTNIFGDEERLGTEKSLLAVGSVINELSQNSTAAAPYLAEFAQRLAGVGAQAGMTIPQIMGFGAVLDAQGQKVEMSATALSKVIMNLFKNPEKIANATGLAVEEFSETCKRSTNEGLMMLLERLHELGGIDSLAPVFADMGENGARASAVLAALAGNIDTVRQQQEAANIAFEEATSVDKEFTVQNTTVQAELEKARKRFNELGVELGEKLLPVLRHIHSGTSNIMRAMSVTIDFVGKYKDIILATAAALTVLTIAVKAHTIAEKIRNAVTSAGVAIQTALNVVMHANPIGLIISAVVALGAAIAVVLNRLGVFKEKLDLVSKAEKSANKDFAEQKAKVDELNAAVHNNNLSLGYRQKALKELKQIVPGYNADLTAEGKLINDNTNAINDYLVALEKELKMKAYKDMLSEQYQKKAQKELEIDEALVKVSQLEDEGARKGKQRRANRKVENLKEEMSDIDEQIAKLTNKIAEMPPATVPVQVKPVVAGTQESPKKSDAPASDPDKERKALLDAIDDWQKREQALNDIAYSTGEKSFSEHAARNLAIEQEFHEKRLGVFKKGSTQYLQEEAAIAKSERSIRDNSNANTLKDLQEFYADAKRSIDIRYMSNEMTYKQYTRALEEAELYHLSSVVDLYKEGSKEYLDAQKAFKDKEHDIQKKRFEENKKIQDDIRKSYFSTSSRTADVESYDEEMMQLEAVKSQLLLAADTEKQKNDIYRAYREARWQIAKKYNMEEAMDEENQFRATMENVAAWLESDGGKAFTQTFSTLVSGMGEIFSGLTSIIDAETDIQTAEIERKYKAEIENAGDNEALVTDIEKRKEAEIAEIKNKAEEKKYGMQVAQAVAQTALSAINAFSSAAAIPLVGFIMAPIAAAMAVAAGAVQIAALKKQRDAALAKGYAAGGYTMPGSKYQPAGIVHAGEWVASQELLANPTAAATIAQLDQAQRTNTIGQLSKPVRATSSDSSGRLNESIEAPQTVDRGGSNVSESIDRLNKTLDGGIYAATTITGDRGILRQQRKHDKMMKNKSQRK